MDQRGISFDTVKEIVKDGKVLYQAWHDRYLFVTGNGVVVTTPAGRVVTAWAKADFYPSFWKVYGRLGFD